MPDPDDEAIRDLSRAREDAVNSRTQARHQLKGSCCATTCAITGKTSWSGAYYRWLATLNFGAGAAQTAFTEYWLAVQAADERVERLTQALRLDHRLALRTGGGCAVSVRYSPSHNGGGRWDCQTSRTRLRWL